MSFVGCFLFFFVVVVVVVVVVAVALGYSLRSGKCRTPAKQVAFPAHSVRPLLRLFAINASSIVSVLDHIVQHKTEHVTPELDIRERSTTVSVGQVSSQNFTVFLLKITVCPFVALSKVYNAEKLHTINLVLSK